MKTGYFFASPEGDIAAGPSELNRPFLKTPSEAHAFLTLKDYFHSVERFLLRENGVPLLQVLDRKLNRPIGSENIREIRIRSEKHGAFFHVASAEILLGAEAVKFAVSTALGEEGRMRVVREYETVAFLHATYGLPYLPDVYFSAEIEQALGKNRETLTMLLSEWFDNYHEWHLCKSNNQDTNEICIWDLDRGHRRASVEEGVQIYREASKILTLFYDAQNFSQIYPWHHAAGDFVVAAKDRTISVRLITARNYKPFLVFLNQEQINPFVAIIYFFLDMTLRMRLDKLDGVGAAAWADGFSVVAVVDGFLEALRAMEAEGRYHLGDVEDLLSLLQGFDREELRRLFDPLMDSYEQLEPEEVSLVEANLETHISQLRDALQRSLS
jgi:hypothetical protein